MTDYTYMGVVAPEWQFLEQNYPEWFDQSTPPEWTLQDIKNSINTRRAEEAAKDCLEYRDIEAVTRTIPTTDGDSIDVRIYRLKQLPQGSTSRPVYIHLHGGGFMFGSLEADDPLCYRVASRLRIIVLSINYRHTPEFVYPVPVNDAWDAVNWAFGNLGDYYADLDKVIIGGISAGANIAAAVSVMDMDHDMHRLTGFLLSAPLCGPAGMKSPPDIISEASVPSYVQNANAPVLTRQRVDFFFDNYKGTENDRYFNIAKLSEGEMRQLHPSKAYFMICGLDPFRDEGIVWRERLSRNGKETKMELYPGLPHGLGLGYVREDVFAPRHKWDNDYVNGVKWLLDL